jgi:membrane-associated phospholipid phosphatase
MAGDPGRSLAMSAARARPEKLTPDRRAALSVAERVDIAAIEVLAPVLRSDSGRALGQLGNLADEPPLLALSAVVCALGLLRGEPRLTQAGARMIAAHLLATSLKELGKDRIERSRPEALLGKRPRYTTRWGDSRRAALRSFPSGHTAGSVALARAASRELAIARWTYPLAGTMGALQVLRRAHFPGDVLAGALVGLLAEAVSHGIFAAARRKARLRR